MSLSGASSKLQQPVLDLDIVVACATASAPPRLPAPAGRCRSAVPTSDFRSIAAMLPPSSSRPGCDAALTVVRQVDTVSVQADRAAYELFTAVRLPEPLQRAPIDGSMRRDGRLADGFDLDALLAPIPGEAPPAPICARTFSPQSPYYRLRDARAEARARGARGRQDAGATTPPTWRRSGARCASWRIRRSPSTARISRSPPG